MELEDKKVAAHSSIQATKKVNLEESERIKTLAIKERKEHQDQVAERKTSRALKEKESCQNQAYKNLESQRQNAMIGMPGMNGMNNFPFQAQNPMMNMMSGMMNMMGMVSAMSGGSSASDPFANMHNGFKQRFNQPSIESPTKNSARDSLSIESVGSH